MGRKIAMKKIEDVTKCQVTFSKRRSSLMKKANEISICCDVDVAFVAFSPSGRVSKFCNQKRIEEVLHRFVNLSADKRLNHINNVQGKMEKLKQLRHINGDTSKLHYLDKQIENLELQIKKKGLELQILETDLRDYEIGPQQEPSLHQLSWCERNLDHSLQTVINRKMELESQSRRPFPISLNQNEQQVSIVENPISGQMLMQLDPWISPYSAKVRESIFQELVDHGKQPMNENIWPSTITLNHPISSNTSKAPIHEESSSLQITSEQRLVMEQPLVFNFQDQNNVNAEKHSLMMDQPLFNFNEEDNVSAYNAPCVVFSDAVNMSTQSSCCIQDPRPVTNMTMTNPSSSEMPQSVYDEMATGMQCIQSKFMSNEIGNIADNTTIFFNGNNPTNEIGNADTTTIFFNDNSSRNEINIVGCEDLLTINVDQIQINYQQEGACNVHHNLQEAPSQHPQFDNLLLQEPEEDNSVWSINNLQKSTSLWEWDDLLLDENFNFQNFPSV